MMDKSSSYRVFISVAEPSADSHCASLITALKKKGYDNIEFVGVGGPKMAAAGCKLLQATVEKAVMIYNAFTQIGHYLRLIRRITHYLQTNKVDLVILCDSPGFNWHIAKAARANRIQTLFYVAPQLWAWAGFRIRKLRKYCDRLCCILPFEEDWFSRRGIDVRYVGHPMLEGLHITPEDARSYADFDPNTSRIVLLPGSRQAELKSLWQPMQQIALRLKSSFPAMRFITVAVDADRQRWLKANELPGFGGDYSVGTVRQVVEGADFAIVASGSVTLQVAGAGCPMVILYQSSRILWHLVGQFLVKTRYLSLVNILAGKELVPEFMPYFSSIDPIVERVEGLLRRPDQLAQLSKSLLELTGPLTQKHASEEVAAVVLQMLGVGLQ